MIFLKRMQQFLSQIGLENEDAETILRQANRQDIVIVVQRENI